MPATSFSPAADRNKQAILDVLRQVLPAQHLAPRGLLVLYGPYLEDDAPTAPGNLAFDRSLRAQDPAWGIRRLEEVQQEAQRAGLSLRERHAMPANNLLLVFASAG